MQGLEQFNLGQPADWLYLAPELVMAFGLLVVLVFTMIAPKKTSDDNNALYNVAKFFLGVSFLAVLWEASRPAPDHALLFGSVSVDHFSLIVRGLLVVGCALTVGISKRFLTLNSRIVSDFYALVMGATLGGMFLAMATDLILIFVGLETLSITSYIMAGFLRRTAFSAEASFKYLIYGSVATAFFLFGLSLIYGLTGTTSLTEIAGLLAQYKGLVHPTLSLIILAVFTALGFKLSLVPFHMWTPDVYDGSPTPVSAFLSVVSKTAAFAVTIRLLVFVFGDFANWEWLVVILSVASMTLGNFVALKQRSIKRLLAYSTIAQAGYMSLGLLTGSAHGLGSILFYLITYTFMNFGAFAAAIYFDNQAGSSDIDAMSGLIQKRPLVTLALSLCLLSLGGIPITAGFFAKFFLFQSVVSSSGHYTWLIIIALLNSAVSLAYYVNVVRIMVVKDPSAAVAGLPNRAPAPFSLSAALAVCSILTLILGVFAQPFIHESSKSIDQMLHQRQPEVSQLPR